MESGSAKQVARLVALGALFVIPLAPLVVANGFFFPFITGKAFFLRIAIETAVVAWGVLALLDKAYRPRLSPLGIVAGAFVLWMFVADAFAPNALKAFWSNFERMEGWVLLAHLFAFFVAASSVLRAEGKWRAWFLTSLGVAGFVTIYAFMQLGGLLAIHQGSTRIDASFGNSAYLAIYLLFTAFVAAWLALTEERRWLRYALLAFAVVEAGLIFFTETRGTIVGLALALGLAAALTALTGSGRARRAAGWALALLVLALGSFYLARDSAFVAENPMLERIASISLADGATRFTIWGMAWQGFLERPLLGWGQEGFNYVFNKYYEPSLYRQELWFDRAHNAFIDWLSAGGLPAFLLYIGLYATAVWLLWRRSELSRPERILLTAALAGYATHNLFVFDNLYSYIWFFAILALIDSQVGRPIEALERAPELDAERGMSLALPVAGVVLAVISYGVNAPGMSAAGQLVRAISPASGGPVENFALFEELAKRPSFAAQEVREQLVSFAAGLAQNQSVPDDLKRRAFVLALSEMQKQVDAYPNDARERLQLAYAYRAAGDGKAALTEVEEAITLSPRKQQMYIEAGAAAWDAGDEERADRYFTTAYELSPQFSDLAAYAAAGKFITGKPAEGERILREAFGTTVVDTEVLVIAYLRTKDWPRLIAVLRARAEKPEASAQDWFALAAAHYGAGDNASAIRVMREAIARFPEAAAAGAAAIRQIESGAPAQ